MSNTTLTDKQIKESREAVRKYKFDLMAYGTGVVKVSEDGYVEHIPLSEIVITTEGDDNEYK